MHSNPSVSHKADTSPINMGGFQFCNSQPAYHYEMRSIEESHKHTGGIICDSSLTLRMTRY